jgi:hypothetical protein
METRINNIQCDWKNVKNKCRTTVNKIYTDIEPTNKFKESLLISEHSPIRLINVDWSWNGIKYWVSTEWSRHKFEKYISSQRNDRTHNNVDRNESRQDAPVNFDGYANAQNLIDACRKRLCYCATPEARELAESLKLGLKSHGCELADVLIPNCVYRCGCPEFKSCGFWERFSADLDVETLSNISLRYKAYNEKFYKNKI